MCGKGCRCAEGPSLRPAAPVPAHRRTGKVPAVIAAWHQAFSHAEYFLLSAKNRLRIPWTPQLTGYFDRNFTPILRGSSYTLYKRTAPGAGHTG
jgi:hypothetical protein